MRAASPILQEVPMIKSDSQLQRDVIEELRWDPSVGRLEIGVACKDGVVTLSGNVDSYSRKYTAVKAAERVSGVKAVAEEMKVVLPSSSIRPDTDIAHMVVNGLHWAIDVPEEGIQARVDDGWVWLEGQVEWQYQRSAAERAVRHLTGVKGVTNLISIKPRASAPDVKQRIETAIKRHAEQDARNITVDAMDGQVTLRGSVRSWAERNDAESAAWAAPGVRNVVDQITIQI
jgi:osmotically-inducible protein OsmY